jgi:general secretion pathway protein G
MTEKGSKRNRTGKHGEKGYTLLELLIVIAILGLIVALAAPQVVGYLGRSKTRAAEIQISSLQSAIELYRAERRQGLAWPIFGSRRRYYRSLGPSLHL